MLTYRRTLARCLPQAFPLQHQICTVSSVAGAEVRVGAQSQNSVQIMRFSDEPPVVRPKTALLEFCAIELDRLSQAVRAERTVNPARAEITDLAYDARRVTPGARRSTAGRSSPRPAGTGGSTSRSPSG